MRTFIKNYIDAKKRQKLEETGEEGFSLIELIIVVVILGVLAAIAIPIFLNIQDQAKQNAVQTVASNGATQAAAQIAQGKAVSLTNLVTGDIASVTYADNSVAKGATAGSIEGICVTAKNKDATAVTKTAGPGC